MCMVNVGKYTIHGCYGAVDGSEILRSPVDVGGLSHHLRRFFYIPGGDGRISEPSTVSMSIFVGYDFATVWVCFLDVL